MTVATIPPRPYSIAHRGASAYAPANTLAAFRKAAALGADMWEVDIRASADGVCIVHHDATLVSGEALNAMSREALRGVMPDVPDLSEVVALAAELGAGIYADIKDAEAALPTLHLLQNAAISPVIIGAFSPVIVQTLKDAGSTYPVAGLVPIGADPHSHAADADVIHLCWEAPTCATRYPDARVLCPRVCRWKTGGSMARRRPGPHGPHSDQASHGHLL
jgi:glycerophosphoryl diester phosphodiesterase